MRLSAYMLYSKATLAVVATVIAAVVWFFQLRGAGAFDARRFQDTTGIQAVVLSVETQSNGYHVHCQLTNESQIVAEHVILTARMYDNSGRTMAQNPLASISHLLPGRSQTTTILVPAPAPAVHATAEVEVTLVSWAR